MSVNKFNPKIVPGPKSFTTIPNNVIEGIEDPLAGWVWLYLQHKSADWIVIKEHIKNKFQIGDSKIKRIFAYLRRVHLIKYIQARRVDGTLEKTEIVVLDGTQFTPLKKLSTALKSKRLSVLSEVDESDINQNVTVLNSGGSKTARADNRTTGSEALLKERIHTKRKRRTKRKRASSHLFPLNFEPTSKNRELANQYGLNLNYEIEKIRDWSNAEDNKKSNWHAALNNWLRRANEKKKEEKIVYQNGYKSNELKSTVKFDNTYAWYDNMTDEEKRDYNLRKISTGVNKDN